VSFLDASLENDSRWLSFTSATRRADRVDARRLAELEQGPAHHEQYSLEYIAEEIIAD
jgi:hypothetical protein